MGRLAILLKKELIQLLKNPKMRITLIVPPMMQLLILGYAATLELRHVDLAVLDYSNSAQSRALIADFDGSPTFNLHPMLVNQADLANKIDTRRVQVALVIPDNFAQAIHGKSQPEVQVIVDGRSASSAGLATAYVQNIVTAHGATVTRKSPRIEISSRAWYNPNYQARFYMAPAVLAMIGLIDVMLINALAMSKEREEGTFDQLRLTPVSSLELLTAKGLSSVMIGACQLTVGLLMIRFWFQVPFRCSPLLILLLLTAFLFAAMGIGLLISVLSRNLQQAILGVFGVIMPFSMLSGLATPVESMPAFLQMLTIVNPLQHGVSAIPRAFLEGATFYDLRFTFYFLWMIAIVFFALAWLVFKKQRMAG